MSIPVYSALERYRAAIAELPASTTTASSPDGAIVVIDGGRPWWDDALVAAGSGAVGLLVSRPRPAPAHALRRLADVPVVLERALLRPDVAESVGATVGESDRASGPIIVECHAPRSALAEALRDALAWARVLAGGDLAVRSTAFAGGRGVALLAGPGDASLSLIVGESAGAPAAGRLRLTTLGGTRRELEVEAGDVRFAVTDASSTRTAARRYESPERLALRRAVSAIDAGEATGDLDGFVRDSALAEVIEAGDPGASAEASTS